MVEEQNRFWYYLNMAMKPKQHKPNNGSPETKVKRDATHDRSRLNSYQRGYNKAWGKARLVHLKNSPLCLTCDADGLVIEANIVDHIEPHRGDKDLFWDTNNWQSLCKSCHDKKTAKERERW